VQRATIPSSHAPALRLVLIVLLSGLLIFAPLAFGLVSGWAVGIFEACSAVLLLIWLVSQFASSTPRIETTPLYAPMLAFGLLTAAQILFRRTAYRYDSIAEFLLYASYAFLIFIVVQLAPHRNFSLFPRIIAVFGSLYALFAVLQGFTFSGKLYWLVVTGTSGGYGSYVNHNHYAGLIELLFPVVLLCGFSASRTGGARILQIFASILMAASVFLCQSRAGMFAITVEIFVVGLFMARNLSFRKILALGLGFCAAIILLLILTTPGRVLNRISDTHDPARLLILRDSISMFKAHPILGSGFGTFPVAFPHYRVFFDGFTVNHAHNDYVELLLDTGLVGLAIGVWFLVAVYRQGFRAIKSQDSPYATIRVAALVACTGLLIHSFADFNLHIPANAALFFVMCAIATAPSRTNPSKPIRVSANKL
jgi:O-antigen ligase